MNAKEYNIASLADFLKVPAEKQDECLRDFGTWLSLSRNAVNISDELSKNLGGKVDFIIDSFRWIDDGISGISALDFIDIETGNTVTLPIKPDD